MKIRFERTTTIVEVGYVEIDEAEGLGLAEQMQEYLKIAKRGVSAPMSLSPWPTKWTVASQRVRTKGEPE